MSRTGDHVSRRSGPVGRLLLGVAVAVVASRATAEPAPELTSTITASPAPAPADALELRVAALEKSQASLAVADKSGFLLKSPDGGFQLKFWGYLHFDSRTYLGDELKPLPNTFVFRRARPGVDLVIGRHIGGRLLPDFGNGQSLLYDGWIECTWWPLAQLRVGKFKTPFGFERLQNDTTLLFIERGLPSNLTPDRDLGIQVSGEAGGGLVSYAAGVFNGIPDAGNVDTDPDDDKDAAARIYARPFTPLGIAWLQDFGVGVGGTYGHRAGSAASPQLPVFKTVALQTWFAFKPAAVAKGLIRRVSPQAGWYVGPAGVYGEYVRTAEETAAAATAGPRILHHESWQAAGSFVLTGEHSTYKGVKPANPVGGGGWGAVEVVARVNELTVDPGAFPAMADPAASARLARGWGVGLNWYMTGNVRLVADYEETRFQGGAAGGADRERERAILGRVQLAY